MVELHARAADAGDAWAMSNLGNCYKRGEAVDKNSSKAVKLYARAPDAGHTRPPPALAMRVLHAI
jgi:uncharacterized protein